MTTVLRNKQRAGRFGREVRDDDAQAVESRTTGAAGADDGFATAGYVIDEHAVATAIVERLIAGRTIPVPR